MATGLVLLSPAETRYVEDGVEQDLRADGRQCGDYRSFSVDTGVVSNTNGSARVAVGGTAVLVGVKLVTAEPDAAAPGKGRVEVMVDCSAGASPAFISRGGDDLSLALASALRRVVTATGALNLDALCIIPGQRVWQLHVDALVLECAGGNLYDCCALAVRAALGCTEINRTEVVRDDAGDAVDFDVLEETDVLDVGALPVLVTLAQVGRLHVVDPTAEEEAVARGHFLVAVNRAGSVCSVRKGGRGAVSPAALVELLRLAQRKGVALIEALESRVGASGGAAAAP